ncbi:hypothetical protein D4Q80_03400 [bacterium]|nr:MAG: hypothetical protein D4Q80_03400 [bacterium]
MMIKEEGNIVSEWKKRLGLLPMPLFSKANGNQFILLNGNIGNFCLDLEGNLSPENSRSYAWSSDVGHYINLKNEHLEVYRWDDFSPKRYTTKSVEEKLEKFHVYLQADEPKRESSVIAFMMRVFRQLRSVINEKEKGHDSLRALLFLIACGADNFIERNKLDLNKWGLDVNSFTIANSIHDANWNSITDAMRGFAAFSLKTEFPLILNHASGKLFQEAHYRCLVDPQLFLGGILPPEAMLLKDKSTQAVGVYYTPAVLARTLVEETLVVLSQKPKKFKVFDPACGSGEFLKEIIQFLLVNGYEGDIELVGWDISPIAIDMTKFIITYTKKRFGGNISLEVKCNDAMNNEWPQDCDIIIMNPPFQSWQDMDHECQDKVKKALGKLAEKRVDLASAFIWRAATSLKNGGMLGTVLPASILSGESYTKFRNEFSQLITPILIGKLGSQVVFSNAIVDSAVFVGKKGIYSEIEPITLWADYKPASSFAALRALRKNRYLNESKFNVVDGENFSIYASPLTKNKEASWSPRSYKSFRLSKSLINFSKVGDIFDVHQGARTGLKSVFVLSKAILEEFPKEERKYFSPAILNDSIEKGMIKDIFYVFYPYFPKLPQINSEHDLKKFLPFYYERFLKSYKDQLKIRCRKNESNWWKLSEPGAWQQNRKAKLVSTYFGKSGSFSLDKSGSYVVVQGYGWVFKEIYKIISDEILFSYLAILCSKFLDNLLPTISNHVGGGQWDLSTRFVKNMPIPNLFNKNLDANILKELSLTGELIYTGKIFNSEHLEGLVVYLYGMDNPND